MRSERLTRRQRRARRPQELFDPMPFLFDPMPFLFDFVSARSPGFSHKLWFSRGLMNMNVATARHGDETQRAKRHEGQNKPLCFSTRLCA